MLRQLFKSVREYKKEALLTLLMIIGEVIIEVAIPFIIAKLVNDIKAGAAMQDILAKGGIMTVLAIVSLAFGAGAGVLSSRAAAGFAKNLRHDVFVKIQEFSFENIDRFSTSSLVTRLTTDVANVQMSCMMLLRMAIRSPLMLIFAATMAFVMGGALAFSYVVLLPVLAIGLYMIARRAMPAFRSVFRKYDKLNESVEENVQGVRVVKGFSREEYEIGKFRSAASNICDDFTKAERIVALNQPLMNLCMYANMVFVLFIGSKLSIMSLGTSMDVGQLSAMITYGVQILMSLMFLSMIYVILTISAESAKRIAEVLREQPSMTNCEEPVMEVANGEIRFKDVMFRYSEDAAEYALKHIDLHIESGMTVGVIGGTGSSKSSLVRMIPRLFDVTSGSVEVAGIDVRRYDMDTLRDAVAMVLQKNVLFSGTIKDNLRWGDPDATDEQIEEAARLAQADEFIQRMPDKYDTYIEQGGTNVSGGQKQRLCIARALLKKPRILILDDSTSAVDTRTDALIRKGFREFIPETTKIIIAQRIASVQDADMIIVMDEGCVAATGRHEELLKSSEIYREVYEQQTKGGDDDE